MKINYLVVIVLGLLSCNQEMNNKKEITVEEISSQKKQISAMLDSFNIAASNSDYKTYFNFFNKNATFIGTDAKENWSKDSFMIWAKPYFDKKKTWNFKALERNIYFSNHADIAWFDELLKTQMKICRGSGVVIKVNNTWKVQQYVLSMTIPNENVNEVIKIKTPIEDSLIQKLELK